VKTEPGRPNALRSIAAIIVVAALALAVGWGADRAVLRHASVNGIYQPQVRLGAATAGLFAGGAAAALAGIALALRKR
jgi:hypothetical protein